MQDYRRFDSSGAPVGSGDRWGPNGPPPISSTGSSGTGPNGMGPQQGTGSYNIFIICISFQIILLDLVFIDLFLTYQPFYFYSFLSVFCYQTIYFHSYIFIYLSTYLPIYLSI